MLLDLLVHLLFQEVLMIFLMFYLQEQFKIPAGKVQMGIDVAILLISLFFVDWKLILISILGAVILNSIILLNHKTNRYVA